MALKVETHFAELAKQRQAEAARRATEIREAKPAKMFNPFSADDVNESSQVNASTVEADLPQPSPTRTPQAADQAAKTVGASGRAVRQAKRVGREAPDLAEQVRAGSLALDAAERETRRRIAERRKLEPEPDRPKPRRAEPIMLTLRTHDGTEVAYPQPVSKPTFNATTGPGISWADWSWNPVTGCLNTCVYC